MASITVKQANQLEVELTNEPGALAKLAEALAGAGVSIQGFTSVNEHHDELAAVHFVTDQDTAAIQALEALGMKPTEQKILELHCDDAPGIIAKLARALADANVNILNFYTSTPGDQSTP